jgi:hypothetical protein
VGLNTSDTIHTSGVLQTTKMDEALDEEVSCNLPNLNKIKNS